MTCRQCGHHFCWICLGNWSEHGSATGGYYQCNVYQNKLSSDTSFADEEKKRQEAQNDLERYIHSYERYIDHERSIRFAKALECKLATTINTLVEHLHYPYSECEFLI